MNTSTTPTTQTEEWDPLAQGQDDLGLIATAQKREIQNILKSYTGYFDVFAEMIQNALDAVEKRIRERGSDFCPQVWVEINLDRNAVTVTDNGCGMSSAQLRSFLRPNFSFKDGLSTRGSKGVGATYLGYGFNHLSVATRPETGTIYTADLRNGRLWLESAAGVVDKPKATPQRYDHGHFAQIDRGTSVTIEMSGEHIRPKNLSYFCATTARQWMALLRVHTALGGIYLCGQQVPGIKISVSTVSRGQTDSETIDGPRYLFPHEVVGRTADLREFLADQKKRADRQQDLSKVPHKFSNLNGIWGEWTGQQILQDEAPIKPRLSPEETELLKALGLRLYVFMCFSTDLWDHYNDTVLNLRKGTRILHGGVQQATKNMPQGSPLTIPLTESIGFQNIAHVIVHFDNAEPDLGRKGFQPEHTGLAERLSASAVNAFKRYYSKLLRRKTGAPALLKEMRLDQWIDDQKRHE